MRRRQTSRWMRSLIQWVVATFALLATTIGPLQLMTGSAWLGGFWCVSAVVAWAAVLVSVLAARQET